MHFCHRRRIGCGGIAANALVDGVPSMDRQRVLLTRFSVCNDLPGGPVNHVGDGSMSLPDFALELARDQAQCVVEEAPVGGGQ